MGAIGTRSMLLHALIRISSYAVQEILAMACSRLCEHRVLPELAEVLLRIASGQTQLLASHPVWRNSRSQLSEQVVRQLSFDPSPISTAGGHLCWLELGHHLPVRNPNKRANAARCTDLGKRATSSPTIKPPRPFLACIISDAGPWMQILRESSFADPRLNRMANLGDGGRWTARAPPLVPPKLGFTAPANRPHDDG